MRLFANVAAVLSLHLCLTLAKKDLLLPKCVKIVSINTPLDDPTRATENYGVRADKKRAILTDKPGIFRIRKGLTDEKGTVSLEALFHPRFYLRHKNYHFHLEKEVNNSVFYKDATFFILKVTERPALYAFELYSHPAWFLRHLKHKPYKMVLRKVNESSKDVLDSTFFLAPHRCFPKKGNDGNAEKKTVLVGGGTFIDTADEDADIASAKANDLHAEDFEKAYLSKDQDEKDDSIVIHTEDDQMDDEKPIKIHTEAESPEENQEEILKEIEDAFRISQNTDNTTYLEKIEKDIEEKVNTIAEKASDYLKKPSIHTGNKSNSKASAVDDIEIHTEADEEEKTKKIHSENDVDQPSHEQDSMHNSSEDNETERTQRVEVLGPVIDLSKPVDQNDETDIDKEIVVTGQPKLNGKLTIDTTYHYNHPYKLKNKEQEKHEEKLAGFSIDDVFSPKTRSNRTSYETPLRPHAVQNKAYKDLTVANKALSSNIEKLKNVLEAIEDVPSDKKTSEKGIVVVRKLHPNALHQQHLKNKGRFLALSGTPQVHENPPYLPQEPSNIKVLKSQSTTQTTITKLPGSPVTPLAADKKASTMIKSPTAKTSTLQNDSVKQTQLPVMDAYPHGENSIAPTSAPGLHVIQGNRNLPSSKARTNASSEVFDHLASELVDHDATGNPTPVTADKGTTNSVTDWMKKLKPHNNSLQETFNELNPDDSAKIFYLGECEDKFPKACEDWAAQRYCLTFSELMKRYCKKACKLCNHVLATGFTSCDKTCGGGVRLRMIKVNNRQVLQRRSCNVQSCPIHGGYTPYSEWSECSVTCGEGVRYRHRSCTNPRPQFGGRDCSHFGAPVDTMPCVKGCKGFKPGKYHSSLNSGLKKGKHQTDRLSPEEFPEYHAEEANPKASDPGEKEADSDGDEEDSGSANEPSSNQDYGHEFEWPKKHHRHKPVVLNHVHKNVYKHRDGYGNNHYLNVDEEQNPYDQLQTHVVRYRGRQVAKMECGPSRLLHYQKHPSNRPTAFERSNPYNFFDAGEIVYDKDGVPTDTTTNVLQAFDSPYKIILQKGKNNQMKVMEQCIESDASVNPEEDLKLGSQGLAMPSEQRSLPTISTEKPAMNSLASNRFAENGLYEYKYQDIGEGVDDNKIESDVSDQLTRAIKNEEAEISQKSLRSQDPKPTLKEELFAEKEEAWREKKYEDSLARRAKVMS
ncbi:uncharacterized protein LOC111329653 isoform X2 [Stylophora pistillata]|uniref:uncharacterized protein LOC111329653 isoform X2 n=1 Tax=Stylophora pistillata TaxID=50429 RepID=UPI000C04062C|nr:uncharacterized protein LOC111329653 isoform X2 [Stylophora pistillata]